MLKSFKYRLYPTEAQKVLIAKHIGSCRFVYNLALETKITAYSGSKTNLTCFDLMKQLPELKKECEWLKEVNAQSLQQSISNLDTAFTKFFKGQADFPNFKKKASGGSFKVPQKIKLGDKLIIPKFQEGIKTNLHRPINGEIRQLTISKTPAGKYFASILCDTGEPIPEKKPIKEVLGVDLGIKTFLVTSGGQEFENPKFLKKAQSRLKFIQRKYSKKKGKRTKQKLVLLHEKVVNQRKDFLHKVSAQLIKNHDGIAIETLNIEGMVKNHNLAQSIQDCGWGEFVRQLEYKAEWYGKNVIKIGRFEPSSKTCSSCGKINKELTLKDRNWTCSCGVAHDRDLNAAINIKNFAIKTVSGLDTETHDELPRLRGVLTREAQF